MHVSQSFWNEVTMVRVLYDGREPLRLNILLIRAVWQKSTFLHVWVEVMSPLICELHVQIYTKIEQTYHIFHVQLLDTLLLQQSVLCLFIYLGDTKRNETTSLTCNAYIIVSIKLQGTLQGTRDGTKHEHNCFWVQYLKKALVKL